MMVTVSQTKPRNILNCLAPELAPASIVSTVAGTRKLKRRRKRRHQGRRERTPLVPPRSGKSQIIFQPPAILLPMILNNRP